MNDQELERNLQSVGKGCFVKYFGEFASNSPTSDVVEILLQCEPYTEKSCRSRVSHARSIISAGRAQDALLMIADAKVSSATREQAKALLSAR